MLSSVTVLEMLLYGGCCTAVVLLLSCWGPWKLHKTVFADVTHCITSAALCARTHGQEVPKQTAPFAEDAGLAGVIFTACAACTAAITVAMSILAASVAELSCAGLIIMTSVTTLAARWAATKPHVLRWHAR